MFRAEGKCSSWKGGIPRGPAAASKPQNGRDLLVFFLILTLPCKGEHPPTPWGPHWVPVSAGSCPGWGCCSDACATLATPATSLWVPTVSLGLGVRSPLCVQFPVPWFVSSSPMLACLSLRSEEQIPKASQVPHSRLLHLLGHCGWLLPGLLPILGHAPETN